MTVASMPGDREGMIVETLDLNEGREKRLALNYFRDRGPLLYSNLAKVD